jgi:tetratricopeptide (TPR) repeat protein
MTVPAAGARVEARLSRLLDQGRCPDVLVWYRADRARQASTGPELDLLVATAAARTADYELASRLAARALAVYDARRDDAGRLRCINVLGGVAFERGLFHEATMRFQQVVSLARLLELPDLVARATNNLASIAHLENRVADAERCYHTALGIFEATQSARGQAQTWHNLSIVYRGSGRMPQASEASDRALELAWRTGDAALIGMVQAERAEIELAQGRRLAPDTLDECRELAAESGDVVGEIEAGRLAAIRFLREARPKEAVTAAEEARERASEIGGLLYRGDCAAVSAEAWDRVQQPAMAVARREEAELIYELVGVVKARLPSA